MVCFPRSLFVVPKASRADPHSQNGAKALKGEQCQKEIAPTQSVKMKISCQYDRQHAESTEGTIPAVSKGYEKSLIRDQNDGRKEGEIKIVPRFPMCLNCGILNVNVTR